ncbi:Forkhead-associated (FHA) domain [Dillenia turbinata]|uniref:Forkhead-associated (FHA) domain n=1 Tax=Dillenia turbinata TaxID=194707 RepID=A0AAN8V3F4_9MAGN
MEVAEAGTPVAQSKHQQNGRERDDENESDRASPSNPKDFIISVASRFSSQQLHYSDPDVWAVLTAISHNARKRPQGINVLLTSDTHLIGRLVEDIRFQIESNQVSACHCKIYKKRIGNKDGDHLSNLHTDVYLRDTSTNGTYINGERMKKFTEAKLKHGDIISFVTPPEHELAFAFVYREVHKSTSLTLGAVLKRKAEDFAPESKRARGIGIGAPEGPISLDDFKSLQRSNMQLRKQLEDQVMTIDTLKNEHRAALDRHENEIKDLKDSISKSYIDQINELRQLLEFKQKEIVEVNRISAEQKHAMEDLDERLNASMQSCAEANEVISSQKASIAELKAQLDEERDQRREEREKAAADLKAAIHRAQLEAQDELNRVADAALRREKEQQEVINKLQESEKERCLLVETLRSKLEDTRQKLVISENRVRHLETQISEEQLDCANANKKNEDLEQEMKRLRKELEGEKAVREEAWAKVSMLELEISAAMRDLGLERRRLKGARERIMLRETQLRAFYSTTEEISVLFAKQQEQLKAMQRTLEDEEHYENVSADIDPNATIESKHRNAVREDGEMHQSNSNAEAGSLASAQRLVRNEENCSDEASVTEKHNCGIGTQEAGYDTQEAEFPSSEHPVRGCFGSNINGVGTAPVFEGKPVGTEQMVEIDSPGVDSLRNIDLNRGMTLAGNTMRLDDDTHVQETEEQIQRIPGQGSTKVQSNATESFKPMEDTEPIGTIRTAELLASEVAGSWACSTAPSVHGENESLRNSDIDDRVTAPLHGSNCQAAESQTTPLSDLAVAKHNWDRLALSEMIGIVAPDLRDHFIGATGNGFQESEKNSNQNSDTEGENDNDENAGADSGSTSDAETVASDQADGDAETMASDQADENQRCTEAMDEDDEATQEDSLG